MADVILKIRLGIPNKNKKIIAQLDKWLKQSHAKPSYSDFALEFVQKIFASSKAELAGVTQEIIYTHNEKKEWLVNLRHPKLGKTEKWELDEIPLKNNAKLWIKLENQWLKAKVEIKGKDKNIVIEPENVAIPITETLFLKW
jgi:hypothetical protein